jgi:hypothetical protein
MNIGNASCFLLSGVMMGLLPSLAPDLFPRSGLDGSSARAMWIQLMGMVNATLGVVFIGRQSILPWFERWLASEPAAQPVWHHAPVPANATPIELAVAQTISAQPALFELDGLEPEMAAVTLRGRQAALWNSLKDAFIDEERFTHFLERFRLLALRYRDRGPIDSDAPVAFGNEAEHAFVNLIQASGINLDLLERRSRNWLGKVTAGSFLREAAEEMSQVLGDARRAA